ncbi:hypothetical protein EKN56_13270 [Limnobaculum zhutongyuii]|uniref:MFS transporter n=1 Tax=Limnobaculum zhutongyuii TaxID=2498113 RepID=A0A411WM72_9GAMM|nr:hypothetical protein [Limnobaculum zhutongyuii]QBH97282.1 hypothetical protein EKN56_13270 [Limnobaculum zhutongyuii]TQS86096.1 hypothetical protein ELQ32_20455 [Limnobaculum zhutongyuii]
MRNIGGSVGLTLMANMLHSRTNMHYSRISDRVTESVDLSVSLENIKEIAFAQARLLSYLDIFYLMAAVCLIFIPLAFCLKHQRNVKRKRVVMWGMGIIFDVGVGVI